MLVGGLPALVSCAARNIEKQPACAAPISSSGLVPFLSPSNRDRNENGASKKPLPPFIDPEPSFRVPFHCALAFAIAISFSFGEFGANGSHPPEIGYENRPRKAPPVRSGPLLVALVVDLRAAAI